MNTRSTSPRRVAALVAITALAVGGLAVTATTISDHSRTGTFAEAADLAAHCAEIIPSTIPGVPDSCAHADEAPPGVDVNKPVPTAVLESREGAAAAAVEAAEDEGVPVAEQLAAVSDRVPCDGDGTSGYRVQAMYVVAAGSANRYPAVSDQIKQWAAGVNTVFNLSAAKTGGVRDVRYVTSSNGDGTCSPTVLNVTVPAGSFSTFASTITAMQNLGYTSPARKYLMWVDGTGQCGIAQTYVSSIPGQDNPNNGYAAQFARIDTGCWGGSQSVEAHELSHTFGSVQRDAPHATSAGHCYDESDRMCYSDGGGKTMQQICAADQEILFDCNNDDYYSTYPPAGSYLDTHWNTADSRWLIGGGDGSGGGSVGTPTTLGGTMTVNNPVVPGLPTQVAVNLEVPSGRTTTVAWKSSRRDCVFGDPAAEQTTLTCDAKLVSNATVTATITDSTGAKLVRTSALTFSTTARAAESAIEIDGSDSVGYVACPSGKAVLSAQVLDDTSGVPVKGLAVAWYRKVGSANPVKVATGLTGIDGVATSKPVALTAGTYTATTTTTAAFPTMTTGAVNVTTASEACTTALTSTADDASVLAGDAVVVSGELTRTAPGVTDAPAAGEKVAVFAQAPGTTTWKSAGSATTTADGSFTVTIKPVADVTLQTRYAGRTGFGAASGAELPVTVTPRATNVTASVSADEVMAGVPVTVTGTLTQAAGSGTAPMASSKVQVTYPLPDGKTATVNATTKATGIYTATIKPTVSGTVTIKYVGKPGWTESTTTKSVTVNDWTSSLTMSATRNASTGVVLVTGTLKVTDEAGAVTPKASSAVEVTYQATATTTKTVKATTKADGSYTVSVKPLATGSVSARYAGLPGWGPSAATPVTITLP